MTELIIEDVNVDLGEANIQINYSIAKIGEIESRSGARSAQINLPKTAKNRLVFENSGDVNSISLKPYRRLKARLKVDGIDQRILFASLESVNETYNIRVYGENVSFYDLIKNKCIDLDLKEYGHFKTFDEVRDSRDNTTGYLYPIIDYNADSPNFYFDNATSKAFVQYLYPAAYYEDVIRKICENVGYTLDNKITELSDYPTDKICIPYSSVPYRRNEDMGRYEATLKITTTSDSGSTASPAYVKITDADDNGYNYFIAGKPSFFTNGTIYEARIIDNVKCNATIRINATNNTGVDLVGRFSFLNDTNVFTFTILAGATSDFVIDCGEYTPYFVANVYSTVSVFFSSIGVNGSNQSPAAITLNTFELDLDNVELLEAIPDIVYGDDVYSYTTISSLLPNIKQSALLLDYLKMFCGLISVNEQTKVVTLFSFGNIAKNIDNAKDWSDKIDLTDSTNVEFAFDYAQVNNLFYAEDETVVKPFNTDSTILIDDENLEANGDMVKLDFAATQQVERLVGKYCSQIKIWRAVGSDEAEFETVKQRVLAVRFQNFSFTYNDGITTDTVTTNIPLPYFIDESNTLGLDFDLGFGSKLAEYYAPFATVLDKTKILTLNLRLNSSDINTLDFTKPVYISYFNSWFYISQIKGYVPNNYESTECELVKLF